jgi:thioredoxin reductase
MEIQDVIIVGGGPAGLNAAVVLGRCMRKVLLFDTGMQRNRSSHGMHNYLTRDDILPIDFLEICYKELEKYNIKRLKKKVIHAKKNNENIFVVTDEEGKLYYAKKLLIATGLSDKLPDIEGLKELYGKSVFHCPYCDGWEVKDKKIAVYAKNNNGTLLALSLKGWSTDVVLFTDGKDKMKSTQKKELEANNIPVIYDPVERLHSKDGKLEKIILKNGKEFFCDALFL